VCGDNVAEKTVAILGLAFKQNTDDIREAAAIDIILALQAAGAKVRVYDPQAMDQARQVLTDVAFCQNAYLCAEGASARVIVTEWDAFRALDLARIKDALSEPIIVDLRNIYSLLLRFVLACAKMPGEAGKVTAWTRPTSRRGFRRCSR
jgi:UDPglucose 6-dehydrogenase